MRLDRTLSVFCDALCIEIRRSKSREDRLIIGPAIEAAGRQAHNRSGGQSRGKTKKMGVVPRLDPNGRRLSDALFSDRILGVVPRLDPNGRRLSDAFLATAYWASSRDLIAGSTQTNLYFFSYAFAQHQISTFDTPDLCKVRANSNAVLPVVITSSTIAT